MKNSMYHQLECHIGRCLPVEQELGISPVLLNRKFQIAGTREKPFPCILIKCGHSGDGTKIWASFEELKTQVSYVKNPVFHRPRFQLILDSYGSFQAGNGHRAATKENAQRVRIHCKDHDSMQQESRAKPLFYSFGKCWEQHGAECQNQCGKGQSKDSKSSSTQQSVSDLVGGERYKEDQRKTMYGCWGQLTMDLVITTSEGHGSSSQGHGSSSQLLAGFLEKQLQKQQFK